MRFGAFLVLVLMLSVGLARSEAWAHGGSATQASSTGTSAHTANQAGSAAEAAPFVGSSAVDADLPASHHDDRPDSTHCLAFVGCGGVGVLAQSNGLPALPLSASALLIAAGSRPQGINLPLEDRPPRTH